MKGALVCKSFSLRSQGVRPASAFFCYEGSLLSRSLSRASRI